MPPPHWLDHVARGLADGRISRREALAHGGRVFAAGAVAGVGYGALTRLPAALAVGCVDDSLCANEAAEARGIANATCAVESPADQRFCYAQAQEIFEATYWQCAQQNNLTSCGVCKHCVNGQCQPLPNCSLSCKKCDESSGVCLDICPEDQYCDVGNGAGECQPKCPYPCAPYDSSTDGCVDTCPNRNPCSACLKPGYCQSNCPNPADFCDSDGSCKPCDNQDCRHLQNGKCVGCQPGCEECQDGSCVSTCEGQGQICCGAICTDCCGGSCDHVDGVCVGGSGAGGACTGGQTCCGNVGCKDLQTDITNCGTCGNVCPPSQSVCAQGQCRKCQSDAECNSDILTCCPDGCDNLQSDPNNCGACGNTCPPGVPCQAGTCATCQSDDQCSGSDVCCGGVCKDVSSDPNNCGECGNVCPNGEACSEFTCVQCHTNSDCETGQTCCPPGVCTDVQTDFTNCGTCGTVCTAEVSDGCTNGVCSCGGQPGCGSAAPQLYCCSETCINTMFDNNNCGTCGNVCPAGTTCAYGLCDVNG